MCLRVFPLSCFLSSVFLFFSFFTLPGVHSFPYLREAVVFLPQTPLKGYLRNVLLASQKTSLEVWGEMASCLCDCAGFSLGVFVKLGDHLVKPKRGALFQRDSGRGAGSSSDQAFDLRRRSGRRFASKKKASWIMDGSQRMTAQGAGRIQWLTISMNIFSCFILFC